MNEAVTTDIAIFGGGIAGLWLLQRLRQSGLSAILFESGTLGGGQTHKSQGIIHGGMKYALQGKVTGDAQAMSDMPSVWRDCLNGEGELDLSAVPILSHQQYLWSPTKLASKLTGFLASAALSSKVEKVAKSNYPRVFQNNQFRGDVFSLDELVIDVPTLIRELAKADQDAVYKIEPLCNDEFQFDDDGKLRSITIYQTGKAVQVNAQQFIFTAGAGNEVIINNIKPPVVAMQLRPLHMVMVKLPFDLPLYAHCLGFGPRPRITVTTHYRLDGGCVWYLGGLLAEEGVSRDSKAQIRATRDELNALFPWLDFSQAEYSTFMVDRAEPVQKNGLKPESSYYKAIHNMMIAWPTKLALAPKLAADMIAHLREIKCHPQTSDNRALRSWPMPTVARSIWEDVFCKCDA